MSRPLSIRELKARGYSDSRIQQMADAKATAGSFAAGRPAAPGDLSPAEREIWESVANELEQRGTLTRGDGPAIELYARTYVSCQSERAALAKEGYVVVVQKLDKHKDMIVCRAANPRARIVADLERRVLALLRQLGMTPAARTARQATMPEKENPQAALNELDRLMMRLDKQGAA